MSGSGPLDFEATIDSKQFNSMLGEMENRIKGVSSTTQKEASKIDDSFRKIATAAAAYFSIDFGVRMTKEIVNVRGEFQQLEIAFETMLRNKAKSDKLMHDVTMFAATTPFDLKQVATGAKQLLAYGTTAEEIIPTLTSLGDISAGLSMPIGDLVYLFGTTRTQGRMMTKDLMQFAGRGIPIFEELSKIFGVTKAEVMELAKQGELKFEHLQEVVKNLTSETGMFGGMMEKQAKSLPGLISNLGDAYDRMLNDIGKGQQETAASAIKMATSLVENYEDVIRVLKIIAVSYGAYKAAVILHTIAMQGYAKALNLVIIKEKMLALVRKMNPWGLAIAGITAVVTAIMLYKKNTSEVAKTQEEINSKINEEVGAMEQLFDVLKRTSTPALERKVTLEKINEKYKDYLPNLLTEKSSTEDIAFAYGAVNKAMRRNIELTVLRSRAEEMNRNMRIKEEEYNEIKVLTPKEFNKKFGYIEGVEGAARARRLASINADIIAFKIDYEGYLTEINRIMQEEPPPGATATPDESDKVVKTFEQRLAEIRKLYENYYLWAESYGKESADQQFKNLLKGGDNYLSYINTQIGKLEGLKKRKPAQDNELLTLLSERNELTGVKSKAELIHEEIDAAKDSYGSLVDYIAFLGQKLNEAQTNNDGGERSLEIIQLLQEALTTAQKQYVSESLKTYESLVEQAANFAKRRLLIEKEFQEDIAKLDKQSLGADKYDEAVKAAEAKRKKANDEVTGDEIRQLEAYRKISDALEDLTNKEVKKYIAQLKEQLLLLDSQSDLYKQISDQIKKAEKSMASKTAKGFDDASQALSQMATMAGAFSDELGESIQFASQLAGAIGKIASGDVLGGILSGVASIFTYVANSAARSEREHEEDKQRQLEATSKLIERLNKKVERQISLLNEMVGADKLKQYGQIFLELSQSMSGVISEMQALDELVKKTLEGRTYSISLADKFTEGDFDLSGVSGAYDRVVAIREAISSIQTEINSVTAQIDNGTIRGDDVEQLQQFLATYQEYVDKLKDIQNQYFEEITGASYTGIVDGVLSAFEQGIKGAENFADNFEDLMRKAMLQALSVNALQVPLQEWYNLFAEMSQSDGELTEAEIAILRERYNSIIDNAEEYARSMEAVAGMSISDDGSGGALSGAIKGVSEETAGLIAGQMNAIRINQAQMLSLMNLKLGVMNQIEVNTRNLVYMKRMYDLLVDNSSSSSVMINRIEG
ncbi:MAG: hypothetical protein K0B15_12270 [Lentimicrobium sp.]|nr:hypothetical protein [Lentimicrobium sp.]